MELDPIIQNSTGQEFIISLIKDSSNDTINDNTSFQIEIEKPDGSEIIRTTGITKVDSKTIKYSTEAAEVDLTGEYRVHARFIKTGFVDTLGVVFIYHVIPKYTGLGEFRRGRTLTTGVST